MIKNNDKISSIELGILIFLSVVGMGILSLPSRLAKEVNNDAWFVLVLAGIINIVSAYVICKVGKMNGHRGFVQTLRYLFGKVIGTVLAIPVMAYCILFMALEIRLFGEVTKLYLLHRTPLEFIIFPLIILIVFLVRNGIESIAHTFSILFFIVGFAVVVLVIASTQNMQLSNLRPFLTLPLSNYADGLIIAIFAFSGFEILLILFPYLKEPNKAFKVSAISISLAAVLFITVTIECICGLGKEETKSLIWPIMALTKSVSIPGGFIEDIEGVLAALWVIYAFTSVTGFMYFFMTITGDIFNHKESKHFASLSIPIIYLFSLQGNSIYDVFKLINFVSKYFSTYTIFILPFMMLLFSLFKGKRLKE